MENRDFQAEMGASMEKRAYQTKAEIGHSSGFVLANSTTQSLAKGCDRKTDNAAIIRELTRAKVAFQLRTIAAVLGEVG